MESVKVFAPATIGNIGPGFDVLGLAIKGIGDYVEAVKTKSGVTITEINSEHDLSFNADINTAGIAAKEVLKMLNEPGGVELKIKKGLPCGSGLGSSAASACAAAYAVNLLYDNKLSKEELIIPATKAEEKVSGAFFADNTAPALLGGATLTRSCLPLDVTKIGSIDELILIVITPEIIVLTKDARAVLPENVPMKDFIFNMANTSLITAAFAKNDYKLFSRCLNDVIVEPVRSKLIRGFDEVKKNALASGADGLAISGSGPTLFAVTNDIKKAYYIEDAMVRTFASLGIPAKSIITKVDIEGARKVE